MVGPREWAGIELDPEVVEVEPRPPAADDDDDDDDDEAAPSWPRLARDQSLSTSPCRGVGNGERMGGMVPRVREWRLCGGGQEDGRAKSRGRHHEGVALRSQSRMEGAGGRCER